MPFGFDRTNSQEPQTVASGRPKGPIPEGRGRHDELRDDDEPRHLMIGSETSGPMERQQGRLATDSIPPVVPGNFQSFPNTVNKLLERPKGLQFAKQCRDEYLMRDKCYRFLGGDDPQCRRKDDEFYQCLEDAGFPEDKIKKLRRSNEAF